MNILAKKFSWVNDQKNLNIVGNKRLRKEKNEKKDLRFKSNENDTVYFDDLKSNLDKKIKIKRKNFRSCRMKFEKNCDEIEIDIFDVNKF